MTTDHSKIDLQRLIAEKNERLKELACLNHTTEIIKQAKPVEETLRQICLILPDAWQFPELAVARIEFENLTFTTPNFHETPWRQFQKFETVDKKQGRIEIFYLKEMPSSDEGPFLKEERHLINNLGIIIGNYLNSVEAESFLQKIPREEAARKEIQDYQATPANSRQLLQKFLSRHDSNLNIFHDLMPFHVKEILLISTLYDAFSIEKEGRFSEHLLGEYQELNLTSIPRITGVTTYLEALEQLLKKHFDLVILMVGSNKKLPFEVCQKIKQGFPYLPVYLLLNNNRDTSILRYKKQQLAGIDRIFVWNGDSRVFFAIVKQLEDKVNLENDIRLGMVKVILLVEDSEKYYSRYLPMLYYSVIEQSRKLIEQSSTDELYKVLKLRARPKILLAQNYEEAKAIIDKYEDNLLCLISDVNFEIHGKFDQEAGFKLISEIKEKINWLPTIIQSLDTSNSHKTFELKSTFINKNSATLLQDIESFISHLIVFGSFVFRDGEGKKIATANNITEFEQLLDTVPLESLVFHGTRNHFSSWLMARGEIEIAKKIGPVKVSDFKSALEFRKYFKFILKRYISEPRSGKIIDFEEEALYDDSNIICLGSGALGGKGRGLAFINSLIHHIDFSDFLPEIQFRSPKTCIIGTDEFDLFLERNHLKEKVYAETDYTFIKKLFIEANLSEGLIKKLKAVLKVYTRPLAIRSSSLFEDSALKPFSGIYETYLLPNSNPDFNERFSQAVKAIKLVFASVFSDNSRTYFKAIDYKIEEEKMAVILQEVVGNQFEQYYYPHISGTAQSYNYYPIAHMKPEDGFAVIALGLGQYVVEGEKAWRFSPVYPNLGISPNKILLKDSQVYFYAIDLSKQNFNLLNEGSEAGLSRPDIYLAEKHGTLKHCASVYNANNDTIEAGLSTPGPRILNFADILKHDYIPLAKSLSIALDVFKEALGAPVEIEFAVDLNHSGERQLPSFYLLQIKPLLGQENDIVVETELDKKNILLYSSQSMGNGKVTDIEDVIYVKPQCFDKLHTLEMAADIEKMNKILLNENRKYVLIGPGRWGSRDRFIGIPVAWPQICNAKVIVETSLEDFPLDASLGSHFFHNVTSMNVGYFSVQHTSPSDMIKWNILRQQPVVNETKYIKHVRFAKPFSIIMNGNKGTAYIWYGNITDYLRQKNPVPFS
ncbi:MAG: PEP/pyruvate-binding domain-containing protein [Bacteroidota bacterium]|nr:PEP/pyruvate-binding domain-containing protein [Bacteroidota bacterium]